MKYVNKMRKQIVGLMALLAMALMFAAPVYAYAEASATIGETVTDATIGEEKTAKAEEENDALAKENAEMGSEEVLTTGAETKETETETGETEAEEAENGESEKKEPPFTFKEGFVFFVCCLFSVVICIVFALWGNPNDRLKARYKRARKQQELREKKLRAQEERQRKFAEEDALYEKAYAEAVAEAEAKAKEKEEARAKKEEEKAQRAAERAARKANR